MSPTRTAAEAGVTLVVAGVRVRGEHFWLCQRATDGDSPGLTGLWEYPGGKVEAGESPQDALIREVQEEFGVACFVGTLLGDITTVVGDRAWRVLFYHVYYLREPQLRVHRAAQWCTRDQLLTLPHLPSGTIFNQYLLRGEIPACYPAEEALHV